MNINSPEILELRHRIENSVNRKIQTPADFDFLRGIIWDRTHEQISASTLKRIWGYIDGVDETRNSTLNIFKAIRNCLFKNFRIFCLLKIQTHNLFINFYLKIFFKPFITNITNSISEAAKNIGKKMKKNSCQRKNNNFF